MIEYIIYDIDHLWFLFAQHLWIHDALVFQWRLPGMFPLPPRLQQGGGLTFLNLALRLTRLTGSEEADSKKQIFCSSF